MATQTAERTEAAKSPIAGASLTTDFQATECKLASVEKSPKGDSLTAKVSLTIGDLAPSQLYELGNLMEAGPIYVTLRSCQLGLGI
jgi:hypothetical protein